MIPHDLLGLPLDEALRLCAERGEAPAVVITAPPRGRETGTLRVVRVREGELTTCRCLDGTPAAAQHVPDGE